MNFKALATAALALSVTAAPVAAKQITSSSQFWQTHQVLIDQVEQIGGGRLNAAACLKLGEVYQNLKDNTWLGTQSNIPAAQRKEYWNVNKGVKMYIGKCKKAGHPVVRPQQNIADTQRQINEIVGAFGNFMDATGQGRGSNNNVSVSDSDRRGYCERDGGSYTGKTHTGEARCRDRQGFVTVAFDSEVIKWVRAGRPTFAF